MGVFLFQSTEATPCGHILKWKLNPKNPAADTMFMAAVAMVLPWKIPEDFQGFVKYKTLTLTLKTCIFQENGFKELTLVLYESLFQGLHILIHNIFGQTISTRAQRSHERAPQKKFKWPWKIKVSFLCLPENVWPSNFGKCSKMPQK